MDVSRTFDILNYNYLMGNLSILKRLTKPITEQYKELKNIASKLPPTAGSISFKKKSLNHRLFAKKVACKKSCMLMIKLMAFMKFVY